MTPDGRRMAFLVTTHPGQPGVAELARLAAAGVRPRKAYVELANMLGADVIDSEYLDTSAAPLARAVARRAGLPAGQVCEAFLRRNRYATVCAWADRLGVPLAALHKVSLSRRNVVLVSDWLSRPQKAVFVRYGKVHSHLRAIVNSSSVQREYAATKLGVDRRKLHLMPLPVDDRFWVPQSLPTENLICAVGMEARDYPTLLEAVRGVDLQVELAVGTVVFAVGQRGAAVTTDEKDPATFKALKRNFGYEFFEEWSQEVAERGLPANVRLTQQMAPAALRNLYARSRFVVVPLRDVDSDCGMSTITEAMAMGKAVIVSRTRGQVDVVRDGEHGIYVPPRDPAALRAAIEHLAAHPEEAERMGRAGRALIEERHTMDAHVKRLAALLQDVGAEAGSGPVGATSDQAPAHGS